MKYRNRTTGVVVEAEKTSFGSYCVADFPLGQRYVYSSTFERDYEPVQEFVGTISEVRVYPEYAECAQRLQDIRFQASAYGVTGLFGFPVGGITAQGGIYCRGDRVPDATGTIDAITNTYHEDGKVTESWTAKNVKDGVVLTNNLTGAIHELPKCAVEALLVLRSCH